MEVKPNQNNKHQQHQKQKQNQQPNEAGQDRPQVSPSVVVDTEISHQVKLIREHILTYARRVSRATLPANAGAEYASLHAAFRTLFELRGEEFKKGFGVFVSMINDALQGKDDMHPASFADGLTCARTDLFRNPVEGRAYIAFIALVTSFAKYKDKQNFGKNKNIGRLTQHVADVELRSLIEEVFNA